MTEKQIIELGQRTVACKRWRWLPGMRLLGGSPLGTYLVSSDDEGRPLCWAWRYGFEPEEHEGAGAVPDLRDPCTRGGLLELVRVATGEHTAFVRYDGVRDGYIVATGIGDRVLGPYAETEVEALVEALESAP